MASTFVGGDARADGESRLVDACPAQLNLSQDVCDGIATGADGKLPKTRRNYVVAQVTGDQETSDALEAELTLDEIMEAAKWMDNIPVGCERQQFSRMRAVLV